MMHYMSRRMIVIITVISLMIVFSTSLALFLKVHVASQSAHPTRDLLKLSPGYHVLSSESISCHNGTNQRCKLTFSMEVGKPTHRSTTNFSNLLSASNLLSTSNCGTNYQTFSPVGKVSSPLGEEYSFGENINIAYNCDAAEIVGLSPFSEQFVGFIISLVGTYPKPGMNIWSSCNCYQFGSDDYSQLYDIEADATFNISWGYPWNNWQSGVKGYTDRNGNTNQTFWGVGTV